MSKEEIIEAVKAMTVVELSELVKAIDIHIKKQNKNLLFSRFSFI